MQAIQATQSDDTHDIRCLLLECSDCCGVWRAYKPERCIYCAREYGLPYTLDPLRRLALFQAIQSIPVNTVWPFPGGRTDEDDENAMQFAIALEDNCQWFDYRDPICVQSCWLALQEHCPWADRDSTAQAKWDDLLGTFQPVPITACQLSYASIYLDSEFQAVATLADELQEDPSEKWKAYCAKKEAEAELLAL